MTSGQDFRLTRQLVHGTVYAYSYGRCRCDPCCEAKRDYRVARTGRIYAGEQERGLGNPEATAVLTGLSLTELVAVCDSLLAGKLLAELVVDLRHPKTTQRRPSKGCSPALAEWRYVA